MQILSGMPDSYTKCIHYMRLMLRKIAPPNTDQLKAKASAFAVGSEREQERIRSEKWAASVEQRSSVNFSKRNFLCCKEPAG